MNATAALGDLSTASALGARTAARRVELRLTQAELANRVGVSREWILRFERGNPGANLGGMLRLLRELNIALNAQTVPIESPTPEIASANTEVTALKRPLESPAYVIADSLDKLHGPASSEISLPKRLLWNPSRPFDLDDEKRARSMLRIVLREARKPEDLEEYVNRDLLTRLWKGLGLPDHLRKAWEQKFPELARASELTPA